jgi:hypothetical protein
MWHRHFAIDFTIQKCNHIINICLDVYHIYVIVNFTKFNLYHVDMCHYIGKI